jgi:hypothetical protein
MSQVAGPRGPLRRSVSSGAVLTLSSLVPIEVRHSFVHSSDAPLLDFSAAGQGCHVASWQLARLDSPRIVDGRVRDTLVIVRH